ncbi:hypothetical protein TWF718_002407 [Orbilia javanica]|uniref:Uncharacterized protein n=1 Tax=Orbilia javanica TaxID=47235 RepID=A0AAN8MME5_9PEZI
MPLPEVFDALIWDIVFDVALEIFARHTSGRLLDQIYDFWSRNAETTPTTTTSTPLKALGTSRLTTAIWAIGTASLMSEPLETLGARIIPHILNSNTVDGEELLYFLTTAITL